MESPEVTAAKLAMRRMEVYAQAYPGGIDDEITTEVENRYKTAIETLEQQADMQRERRPNWERVHFTPWIGDNYWSGHRFGKRVLVLGEAHYTWDEGMPPLPSNLTIQCIEEQISGEGTYAFWTKIAIAFLNEHPSVEDKKEFWHSVSFYNYIQESVGLGPRVRPTEEMWENAREPFDEVLSKLCPQFIAVLGYELWDALPADGSEGPRVRDAKGHDEPLWRYPHPEGEAWAFRLMHPSARGFSARSWHTPLMQALERAPGWR